jgi:molecular chaperone GrpE
MPYNNDELPFDQVNDVEETASSSEAEQASPQAEDVASLQKELNEEKAKAERYLANWQRSQADYINFKKRSEQEKDEVKQFGNAMLIVGLLPVLDDLERALASVSAKMAGLTWVDGVRLIYHKFRTILEAQGLSEIKAMGQPFEPKLHEAVMRAPGEEGIVIEELQKGYKLRERVIRPSMVVVGQGKEKTDTSEGK